MSPCGAGGLASYLPSSLKMLAIWLYLCCWDMTRDEWSLSGMCWSMAAAGHAGVCSAASNDINNLALFDGFRCSMASCAQLLANRESQTERLSTHRAFALPIICFLCLPWPIMLTLATHLHEKGIYGGINRYQLRIGAAVIQCLALLAPVAFGCHGCNWARTAFLQVIVPNSRTYRWPPSALRVSIRCFLAVS